MPDIIDTRDLHDRLEELDTTETIDLDENERRELEQLQTMCDTISDWLYGETLIHEDYFETYARDLAEDIGAIDSNADWLLAHIDWTAAADALKQDYTEFEYKGETYYALA